MRTHRKLIGFTTAALFVVTAGSAQAQGKGHDKDKDKHKAKEHVQKQQEHQEHRESEARHRVTDAGHHVNDGHHHIVDRRVPPGLAKKPGGMPPGQYKKRHTADRGVVELRDVFGRHGYTVLRSENSGDRRYVYYRASDGTTHRAIVRPGSDRLHFSNVPASLVQEVLARLY